MRNFWAEITADGVKNPRGTGPLGRNGSMKVDIKQKVSNDSKTVVKVECFVKEGYLVTQVIAEDKVV